MSEHSKALLYCPCNNEPIRAKVSGHNTLECFKCGRQHEIQPTTRIITKCNPTDGYWDAFTETTFNIIREAQNNGG